MLALLHRSDQPVRVHGGSSEGPVGHEPAEAGHQRHRLGHPKVRHDSVTTRQRVSCEDLLVWLNFFALFGYCCAVSAARSQHWHAVDRLQGACARVANRSNAQWRIVCSCFRRLLQFRLIVAPLFSTTKRAHLTAVNSSVGSCWHQRH